MQAAELGSACGKTAEGSGQIRFLNNEPGGGIGVRLAAPKL